MRRLGLAPQRAKLRLLSAPSAFAFLPNFAHTYWSWALLASLTREFNGLGGGVPKHLDLCEETIAEREQFIPYLPSHLLPMENDGGGITIVLIYRRSMMTRGWCFGITRKQSLKFPSWKRSASVHGCCSAWSKMWPCIFHLKDLEFS